MHKSTIKSQINKNFSDIEITEIKNHMFGMFSVKVNRFTTRTKKVGMIYGETDYDANESGCVLDKKITWLGSVPLR
tara:strand:+ start:683 stop:910 length:228 start_codon:yes stop_codon:yes gene_type:complete